MPKNPRKIHSRMCSDNSPSDLCRNLFLILFLFMRREAQPLTFGGRSKVLFWEKGLPSWSVISCVCIRFRHFATLYGRCSERPTVVMKRHEVPSHLRPVILKPVGRIFEISDSKPIQGKCGKCGRPSHPRKTKGLRRFHRTKTRKTRKMRKMRTRRRGKCGKCGWLALMWLALGDPHKCF